VQVLRAIKTTRCPDCGEALESNNRLKLVGCEYLTFEGLDIHHSPKYNVILWQTKGIRFVRCKIRDADYEGIALKRWNEDTELAYCEVSATAGAAATSTA